jgi:DNA-binding response OmpR family regulator
MKKVLVIEDDRNIAELLEIHLRDLDCEVERIEDGNKGLEAALAANHDLIVLDLMLPGTDGMEICRRVRGKEIHTPILMLTAKSEEIDKVMGLESGADDYLTKPFSVREFIARVKAIFRRMEILKEDRKEEKTERMDFGELKIEPAMRKVTLGDNRVELTPKEFDLLVLLARHPGRSYSRSQLLSLVWGYEFSGYEHTVNSHINRLRMKIEPNPAAPMYILTTWGVGYRFKE